MAQLVLLRTEKWLALAIVGFGFSAPEVEEVAVEVCGGGAVDRRNEEDSEDNESEDPLERDDLRGELLQGKCCVR